MGGRRVERDTRISISQDWTLERRLGQVAHVGLFADPAAGDVPRALPGQYRLEIEAVLFEPESTLDATLVSYGRVHGIAGTDHQRRDLTVALLWGTPVALAFGLIAAVGTTFATLVIAAAGVWFGGWLDALIQRVTEVNMILPVLPILVMVGTLYSTSIWLMLGVVVAFGVFSASIKMYRSMLLPIREAPYIEAARAYGAGNARIILRYMIPRILPVLIPNFVTLIPSFVFLEASLAVLGLGDPQLPTWGKVMNDAQVESALYHGYYYWVVGPAALLMLTGLGFAMLGFALDRIFNPRLRMI
jgi:peptide/nickel transport system permease protein